MLKFEANKKNRTGLVKFVDAREASTSSSSDLRNAAQSEAQFA